MHMFTLQGAQGAIYCDAYQKSLVIHSTLLLRSRT